MKRQYILYDEKCKALARYFLREENITNPNQEPLEALSVHIQKAVEAWFDEKQRKAIEREKAL